VILGITAWPGPRIANHARQVIAVQMLRTILQFVKSELILSEAPKIVIFVPSDIGASKDQFLLHQQLAQLVDIVTHLLSSRSVELVFMERLPLELLKRRHVSLAKQDFTARAVEIFTALGLLVHRATIALQGHHFILLARLVVTLTPCLLLLIIYVCQRLPVATLFRVLRRLLSNLAQLVITVQ
jgi:hypothetical protein